MQKAADSARSGISRFLFRFFGMPLVRNVPFFGFRFNGIQKAEQKAADSALTGFQTAEQKAEQKTCLVRQC